MRHPLRAAGALVLGAAIAAAAHAKAPTILSATFVGTAGDDNLEGASVAPDGTIYVAGNAAEPMANLPGGATAQTLGRPRSGTRYGCAFVARLSGDAKRLLACVQLAPGIGKATSVAAGPGGVYVGGYANDGLEPVIARLGGLQRRADMSLPSRERRPPGEHHSEPHVRPENNQRGVPFVLALSADLARVEGGTVLEGWQSVWHVPWPLAEDRWQPTALGLLPDGDEVVAHDGGYHLPPPPGKETA
jgi:hypothetical protein